MRIYTEEKGGKVALFVLPETDDEGHVLSHFAHMHEPLIVALKHDRSWKFPHIEIKKKE